MKNTYQIFTVLGIGVAVGAVVVVIFVVFLGAEPTHVSVGPVEFEIPATVAILDLPTATTKPSHIETLVPTVSASQGIRSTETNPVLALPFQDNFNSGLSNEWRVTSGNPVISMGHLTAEPRHKLVLEIGNNELWNYSVKFDYFSKSSDDLTFYITPSLAMMLDKFSVGRGNVLWLIRDENGKWDVLEEIDEPFDLTDDQTHWQLDVVGNQYRVLQDGLLFSELIYGNSYAGSPLSLMFKSSTKDHAEIDNFVITAK